MQLDPDQKEVYDTLLKRYKKYDNQLLPAATGFGKSRVGANIALHMCKKEERKILVLCPKTLIPMWQEHLDKMSIEMICTYNKLAGNKSGCKHNLLTRKNKVYCETKYWSNQKVFIICDESQAIKNPKTAQHISFFALIKNHPNCKVLHLTAAPIDKRDNWVCLYRNLGLIKSSTLIMKGEYENYGLGDLFNVAKKYDKHIVKNVATHCGIKKSKMPDILQYMWVNIFRKLVVIEVKDPIYKHPITGEIFEKKMCNFFATLDKKGTKLLNEAMVDLGQADIINKNNDVNEGKMKRNLGVVILSLMKLSRAKLTTIVRLSKVRLENGVKDPLIAGRKIVIFCQFIDDQHILYKSLEKYNPLLLNGKSKNRDDIINKFNQHDLKYRCIIISVELGEGISLHDTHGGFPRTMFIIPTYHFLKAFQASGRCYRRGLMSDVEIMMLYSNVNMVESILVNLLLKTEVANDVLIPGSGRVFPGQWDSMIEDENETHKELREKIKEEQEKYNK